MSHPDEPTDLVGQLRHKAWYKRGDGSDAVMKEAADRIEMLEAWKSDAMDVIECWEITWEIAGQPGKFGVSKPVALTARIKELQAANRKWFDKWNRMECEFCGMKMNLGSENDEA